MDCSPCLLRADERYIKPKLVSWDPHAGNVLIDDYNHLALCDFGTSYYNSTVDSWARHWRIVDEVMRQLLSHFATFEIARAEYPAVFPKNSYREMLEGYRYVFGVLGAEVHMFSDGIDHLHEDQRKILRLYGRQERTPTGRVHMRDPNTSNALSLGDVQKT